KENDQRNQTASGESPAGWRDQGGDLAERKRERPLLRRDLRPDLQERRGRAARHRQLLGHAASATGPPGRQSLRRRGQADQSGKGRRRYRRGRGGRVSALPFPPEAG